MILKELLQGRRFQDEPPVEGPGRRRAEVRVGRQFVRPQVEGADGDGPPRHHLQQLAIDAELLLFGRQRAACQEEELATVQADAAGPLAHGGARFVQQIDVDLDARQSRRRRRRRFSFAGGDTAGGDHAQGRRIEEHRAGAAIDEQAPAGVQQGGEVGDLTHHGDVETAGQDGGMALRPAVLDDHGRQPVEIDGEQLHHRRFARHQHEPVAGRVRRLPRPQLPENTMKDILDIVDALLQERRRHFLQGGDVLVQRGQQGALRRGAASQAGVEVLLDSAVLHDEELRLQDGAVVLADQLGDALAQTSDLLAGAIHRLGEPDALGLGVSRCAAAHRAAIRRWHRPRRPAPGPCRD